MRKGFIRDSRLSDELNDLKELRHRTGAEARKCKEALNYFDNLDVAEQYLRVRSQAVARYKIIDGKKILFGIEDYKELAVKQANKLKAEGYYK